MTPIEQVLAALEEVDARYLVVGGVAVVLHGRLRATADLDLVLSLDTANLDAALSAFVKLDLRPRAPVPLRAFADSEKRADWVENRNMTVFSLWSAQFPGLEVDIFVEPPFDFDEVYARSIRVRLDQTDVSVVSLPDLIAMKQASGRALDLDDIAALEALQGGDDPS
jgi:predicted nucleotidyltransferase